MIVSSHSIKMESNPVETKTQYVNPDNKHRVSAPALASRSAANLKNVWSRVAMGMMLIQVLLRRCMRRRRWKISMQYSLHVHEHRDGHVGFKVPRFNILK